MSGDIVKTIKVPFALENGIPEGYSIHAKEEFDLGDETMKENITIHIYKKM
jgi:hypothetical protein